MQNTAEFRKHNKGFCEKGQFFRQKNWQISLKIVIITSTPDPGRRNHNNAPNNHNIDPQHEYILIFFQKRLALFLSILTISLLPLLFQYLKGSAETVFVSIVGCRFIKDSFLQHELTPRG
jgi:hypothetical protein